MRACIVEENGYIFTEATLSSSYLSPLSPFLIRINPELSNSSLLELSPF